MTDKELLRKKTIQNRILIFVIVVLLVFGLISYKKYFDEKREREIGESIKNAMSETNLDRVEENLSVMDKMSFSEHSGILFISICCFKDDGLKLGELADAIEEAKEEYWFNYDYVIINIWNPQIGMVTSIEINLDTMETRSCEWNDND